MDSANLSQLLSPEAAALRGLAGDSHFAGKVQDVRLSEVPDITARVYVPSSAGTPVLVYFHGGGWVAGNAEAYDGCMRRLASLADVAIVSVNYRLAPEHTYPAALDDAYTAVEWARDNAALFGWSKEKVAVGGDSAGANLAAAVCLLCRDRQGPAVAMQLLVSPILDHDFGTESHRRFRDGLMALTYRDILWFFSHYLNRPEELDLPHVSPMLGALAGLPRALIITAAVDPLRDDAVRYAERLRTAGVEAESRVFDGMFHGFWIAPAVLPQADEAFRLAASRLAQL